MCRKSIASYQVAVVFFFDEEQSALELFIKNNYEY